MAKFLNMYHKMIISIEQPKHYFVDFPNKQNSKFNVNLQAGYGSCPRDGYGCQTFDDTN